MPERYSPVGWEWNDLYLGRQAIRPVHPTTEPDMEEVIRVRTGEKGEDAI